MCLVAGFKSRAGMPLPLDQGLRYFGLSEVPYGTILNEASVKWRKTAHDLLFNVYMAYLFFVKFLFCSCTVNTMSTPQFFLSVYFNFLVLLFHQRQLQQLLCHYPLQARIIHWLLIQDRASAPSSQTLLPQPKQPLRLHYSRRYTLNIHQAP